MHTADGSWPQAYAGLERLLAVAIVDAHIAQLVISDPQMLIDKESAQFHLTSAEQVLLLTIKATDIYDFANQLHEHVQQDVWHRKRQEYNETQQDDKDDE